jgi:magnesium chelatase family protein
MEVPQLTLEEMQMPGRGESSSTVAERVAAARAIQTRRFQDHPKVRVNADASGRLLEEIAPLDSECRELLGRAASHFGLTPRGYHRILRVARTIADLDGAADIRRPHLSEALSIRVTFKPD